MKKLIFILLYLLGVGCAYAQNNNESSKFDSIVYLSPRAFNDWVWELRKKVIKKEISPQIIIDKTMERLKISLYVEEETLVQVANLWKYYLEKEAPTIDDVFAEKDKNSDVFKKTILIADSLITLLPKSDLRKWMLIRFKAGFLDLYDQGNEIEKDYLNNVKDLEYIFNKANEYRMMSYLRLAQISRARGDEMNVTENYLSQILPYYFWLAKDPHFIQIFSDYNIRANLELLELRKDDLELLKITFFMSPVKSILEPIKERYIKKLEERKKE